MANGNLRIHSVSLPSLVRLIRPHNGAACALLALAGYWHGGNALTFLTTVSLTVALFFLAAASHIFNDIVDLAADRTNRPTRPLARGQLSLTLARRAVFVLGSSGFLIGLLARPSWWSWWLFWLLAGLGYSVLAKGRGWLAPFWTAVVIASCYLAGAMADGLQVGDVLIFLTAAYFVFFREFIKSLEDGRGDGQAGYRTLAGTRWDSRSGLILLALPLGLVALSLCVFRPAGWLGFTVTVAFLICLAAALFSLPVSRRRGRHLAGSMLKGAAFCGLVHLWVLPLEKWVWS